MAKLKVRTEMQRLDSTMILSNIADLDGLLVELLQRLWRVLKWSGPRAPKGGI